MRRKARLKCSRQTNGRLPVFLAFLIALAAATLCQMRIRQGPEAGRQMGNRFITWFGIANIKVYQTAMVEGIGGLMTGSMKRKYGMKQLEHRFVSDTSTEFSLARQPPFLIFYKFISQYRDFGRCFRVSSLFVAAVFTLGRRHVQLDRTH
jgi:hypothetical protein